MQESVTHTFAIEGLRCDGCAANARRALENVAGVEEAEVILDEGRAKVRVAPGFREIESLDRAITEAGYSTDLAEQLLGVSKIVNSASNDEPRQQSPKGESGAHPETESRTTTLALEGMSCASCVATIESALVSTPGVLAATINFANHRAVIKSTGEVDPRVLIKSVEKAGYGAEEIIEADADPREALERERGRQRRESNLWRGRFIVAGSVSILLMATINLPSLGWLRAAAATAIQLGVGFGFYVGAIRALRSGSPNMDTLIALGTTAAWGNGMGRMIVGEHAAHDFMTASMLLAFISLGKWLETRGRLRAGLALQALLELAPGFARRIVGEEVLEIDARELIPGDECRVWEGDRVPADGRLIEASAEIDESMLTGESVPVVKLPEEKLFGGTLNVGAAFSMVIEKVGADTALREIARRVEQAQITRPRLQKLADKAAAYFVPVVIVIAAATLVGALASGLEWDAALARTIAVLIVACPCALGLAIPLAVMAGVGVASRKGIVVRTSEALEVSSQIDIIVFDKTGTLTEGAPSVTAIFPSSKGSEEELIAIASGLEKESSHPLAAAIRNEAETRKIEPRSYSELKSVTGGGVLGRDESAGIVSLGTLEFLEEQGIAVTEESDELIRGADPGHTVVFVGDSKRGLIGAIAMADAIRKGSANAIKTLGELDVRFLLLSGDSERVARAVGETLGIEDFRARVAPGEKADVIAGLQGEGRRVAMVGDGINDAPALAQADLGIAMGGGSDIAQQSADIVLMGGDPVKIPAALKLARSIRGKMIQNLVWAFAYNIALIPLAAFGVLEPIFASIAMAFSSVSVVSNSLLLYRK